MLLYLLLVASVGVEGGYSLPAVGFHNIESGVTFSVFVNHHFKISDLSVYVDNSFYSGKNGSYSVSLYGMHCGFSKNNWRLSPLITFGADYLSRRIDGAGEDGFAFAYSLGFLLNFHSDNLRVYPLFCYKGLSDFKTHAGFIAIKLGVAYDFCE
ncbi:MAG TPA: hypothetical protein ENI34_09940 [candidate division WOR-3 bacterium]|uniref:Uncharacterized protein n=1 Tax=candidate division WOR-3 bacterium TaxID=2052148 RepID=A0A9C9ENX9_UNCW3|nr:hypothetical protein [candidate division WOR-3 bacterium]